MSILVDYHLVITLSETTRLRIRPWISSDIEVFVDLCRQPGLNEFTRGSYRDMTSEKAREFIEKEAARFRKSRTGKFGIFLPSGQAIGVVGLFEMSEAFTGKYEINYRLPSAYWGCGYGTEAAQAIVEYAQSSLKLLELYGVVDPKNTRSQNVLSKVGMSLHLEQTYKGKLAQIWQMKLGL